MKNKVLMGLAAIAMVAVLASCGKVPQAEIDATNAAIAAAQAAEANVYLPAEFTAVQDSMSAINAAVKAQEGKLFKKFTPVKEKLASTLALANQVAANAAVKKEEVKKEAETTLTEVNALIAETKDLVTKAPKGKEGKAALEAIQQDITLVENTVTAASTELQNGEFLTANDRLKAAKEKLNSIKAELQAAIDKVKK